MRSLTTGNVELDIHTILAPSILNTFRSSIQPDSPLRGCDEELYSSATRGMYTRFLTVAHLDESTSEVNMVLIVTTVARFFPDRKTSVRVRFASCRQRDGIPRLAQSWPWEYGLDLPRTLFHGVVRISTTHAVYNVQCTV